MILLETLICWVTWNIEKEGALPSPCLNPNPSDSDSAPFVSGECPNLPASGRDPQDPLHTMPFPLHLLDKITSFATQSCSLVPHDLPCVVFSISHTIKHCWWHSWNTRHTPPRKPPIPPRHSTGRQHSPGVSTPVSSFSQVALITTS